MSPRLVKGLTYFNQRYHHLEKESNSISNMLPTLHGKWKIISLLPPITQFQPTEYSALHKNGRRLNGAYKSTTLNKQHIRDLIQPSTAVNHLGCFTDMFQTKHLLLNQSPVTRTPPE